MKSLTADRSVPFGTRLGTRLADSRLRRWLRQRPAIQGRILAPAAAFRRRPVTAGLYFPFYHDVPRKYVGTFRGQLAEFRGCGSFVSWKEAMDILYGRRRLSGPTFCLSFDDGHHSWVDVVLPILRDLDISATFFVVTGAVDRPGASGAGSLSWAGCAELAAAGMAIGSHTRSHLRLAWLDDATATAEIRDSKSELEDRLGHPVHDFAAPYGWPTRDFTARDVALAQRAGYRSFASTLRAAMHPGDSPLAIRRQGLHPAWPLAAVRTRVHE